MLSIRYRFLSSQRSFKYELITFMLFVSLTIIDVSNKSSSWVVFCCTSLWLESRQQWILSDVSWPFTLLHSTTLSRFPNWIVKEWIISSLSFNCSLRNVMSSCNCFIKCSEFSPKTSLPQDIKCLFLKESTSAKNDDFRASNPSITESLDFDNSSLILTLNNSLNYLTYWILSSFR